MLHHRPYSQEEKELTYSDSYRIRGKSLYIYNINIDIVGARISPKTPMLKLGPQSTALLGVYGEFLKWVWVGPLQVARHESLKGNIGP